jgi:hypothetical protein
LVPSSAKTGPLPGQQADLLAREREVAAQGARLVEVSAIAHSMTQVLEQLRVGLGQAGFEQRRQLVELLIDRVVVSDGQVEIRDVIPTTDHSTKTRFCHLRTDYFDPRWCRWRWPRLDAQPEQLALDALVAPARMLLSEADDQLLEVIVQRWPPVAATREGPGSCDHATVPAQQATPSR